MDGQLQRHAKARPTVAQPVLGSWRGGTSEVAHRPHPRGVGPLSAQDLGSGVSHRGLKTGHLTRAAKQTIDHSRLPRSRHVE